MLLALLATATVLAIIYFKLRYFTLRGRIPGSPPHFLFGSLIQSGILFGEPLPRVLEAYRDRYGDIFQFWFGPSRVIVINNVNDLKHVFTHRQIYEQGTFIVEGLGTILPGSLASLTGADFKRHSAITQPLFRRNKIVCHLDMIVNYTDKLLSNWRLKSSEYVHCNILQQCQDLQLGIFGFVAFDYDLQTLDDTIDLDNHELSQAIPDFLDTFKVAFYWPRFISSTYLNLNRRHRHARATIARYLDKLMENEMDRSVETVTERKRTHFIASLVSSLQQDEDAQTVNIQTQKKGLSRTEILNEMLGFMVAGFDTTSATLAWTIHLLSKHPRVQQKIKAELIEYNAKHDLSQERLDSLIYLDCVMNEVLRYAMPAIGAVRTLTTNDRLPESGFQIFKGDTVYIPSYTLSRDTRYWKIDPELFYPERFLTEDKDYIPYAFLPFGGGHRQCIAQDLARFEIKLVIARLMQHVTIGDGGPEVNAGGQLTKMITAPRYVGVTIAFD